MRDLDELFAGLAKSRFRSQFRLNAKDRDYLHNKGLETVLSHAQDFVEKRLAAAEPRNDGKQTPFRGHPVFVAQHATACCCRGCLEKWHKIPQHRELSDTEQSYIGAVLERWLSEQL
ncbi:Uncharacterized protein YneG [Methylomonas albis]|uniref:DUF4186 domain-containing protein n=1 Tax=Methylomonas albis TaxID=1854563 RepID=A0ABR9D1W6_9GAMM|nr:DUF4186 domain-containing protein [Methylomonas albis]MBD9357077.1 DUF4186 domain-containing protein [Methylomonas albis]CAD6880286.1 Uncharacterized protein YneG [Methylomonas albis]